MITTRTSAQDRISQFFPLKTPRQGQLEAMEFIDKAASYNYEHIVIEAPTGTGKTLLGAATCLWAGQGFYLVTQKLLQDQLEKELEPDPSLSCHLLKSATDYPCPKHKNCSVGSLKKCDRFKDQNCSYQQAKAQFLAAKIGVTNYPYFLTERLNVAKMPPRPVMVLDECHTVEKQILRLVDFSITSDQLEKWNLELEIPKTAKLGEFLSWVEASLMPKLGDLVENIVLISEDQDEKMLRQAVEVVQHANKIKTALALYKKNPENWVYWQQEQESGTFESIIRPLDAAPFAKLLFEAATLKLHMSAYPGSKDIYCRSLGLEPKKVAWLKVNSEFEPARRPVLMTYVGPMRKASLDATLPKAIKFVGMVLDKHPTEKGLIHTNSYKIAQALVHELKKTVHGPRLIFPEKGEDREEAFERHKNSTQPSVILSPSMTEGFDFAYDLARWQVIMKTPFPNLGDKQVDAKRQLDPAWYQLETVKTIVQATGRICRAKDDFGVTYFLDSDFELVWSKCQPLFPGWWKDAVQFMGRKT